MSDRVRAAALTGPGRFELLELDRPRIGTADGLLRVEACGICGSDVMQYHAAADRAWVYPTIPGHETLGLVEEIGEVAAARWGVVPGDRVAVEPPLPCGQCRGCHTARTISSCLDTSLGYLRSYSQIPVEVAPGLWGGYAELMYLHPLARLHPVPAELPATTAVLFNPLANGVQWAVLTPDLKVGDAILVLGPGQRGLASVVAAREAGAGFVAVTGLSQDRHKLELARRLGADVTIVVDEQPLVERLREASGDRPIDVVVDTTPGALQPVTDAMEAVRPGGTVVLAGLKHDQAVPNFVSDRVVLKELRLQGVRTATSQAFRTAIEIVASRRRPLDEMHTHAFGLEEAERAVTTLEANLPEDRAIAVCIVP